MSLFNQRVHIKSHIFLFSLVALFVSLFFGCQLVDLFQYILTSKFRSPRNTVVRLVSFREMILEK